MVGGGEVVYYNTDTVGEPPIPSSSEIDQPGFVPLQ
jgi:hypothetical protein